MYCSVKTAVLTGIESKIVTCESDVSNGLPYFAIVGLLSTEVKESRERVKTALKNSHVRLPTSKITVNISPASIRKSGTGFDLPIAVSIMGATNQVSTKQLDEVLMIGEMTLSGEILPVKGVLSAAISCKEANIPYILVPKDNAPEASLIPDIKVIPVSHLRDVISIFRDETDLDTLLFHPDGKKHKINTCSKDFKDLKGNRHMRRALEVAVSGMHNLLMIGPPGAGKTMAASCVPSILPPMTPEEKIEISKIYSAAGLFQENNSLIEERPFRAPHNTISKYGLVGGGASPLPGEITLSSGGVLFLDEILEFKKDSLDLLRQPMEDHVITISRSKNQITYPADFMLIAASNPCPCGHFPDLKKCHCSETEIHRYLSRLSGPLMDRIDITVSAHPLTLKEMSSTEENEDSKTIQKRVMEALMIQKERFKGTEILFNSRIPSSKIETYCSLKDDVKDYLTKRLESIDISMRAYNKLLKISRTIADLDSSKDIERKHLDEGIMYIMKGRQWQSIF